MNETKACNETLATVETNVVKKTLRVVDRKVRVATGLRVGDGGGGQGGQGGGSGQSGRVGIVIAT